MCIDRLEIVQEKRQLPGIPPKQATIILAQAAVQVTHRQVLHDHQGLLLAYAGAKELNNIGIHASLQQHNLTYKADLLFLALAADQLDGNFPDIIKETCVYFPKASCRKRKMHVKLCGLKRGCEIAELA